MSVLPFFPFRAVRCPLTFLSVKPKTPVVSSASRNWSPISKYKTRRGGGGGGRRRLKQAMKHPTHLALSLILLLTLFAKSHGTWFFFTLMNVFGNRRFIKLECHEVGDLSNSFERSFVQYQAYGNWSFDGTLYEPEHLKIICHVYFFVGRTEEAEHVSFIAYDSRSIPDYIFPDSHWPARDRGNYVYWLKEDGVHHWDYRRRRKCVERWGDGN